MNRIQKIILSSWVIFSAVICVMWFFVAASFDATGIQLIFTFFISVLFLGIPTSVLYKLWADEK